MPVILFDLYKRKGTITKYDGKNYNVIYRRTTLDINDILNKRRIENVIVEDNLPKHPNLQKLEDITGKNPPESHFYIGFLLIKEEDGKVVLKLLPYKGNFRAVNKNSFYRGLEKISKELSKIHEWAIYYGLSERKYEGPNFYIVVLENTFIKIVLRIPFLTEGFYLAKIFLPGRENWEFKEKILASKLPLGKIKEKYYDILMKSRENRHLAFMVPLYGCLKK